MLWQLLTLQLVTFVAWTSTATPTRTPSRSQSALEIQNWIQKFETKVKEDGNYQVEEEKQEMKIFCCQDLPKQKNLPTYLTYQNYQKNYLNSTFNWKHYLQDPTKVMNNEAVDYLRYKTERRKVKKEEKVRKESKAKKGGEEEKKRRKEGKKGKGVKVGKKRKEVCWQSLTGSGFGQQGCGPQCQRCRFLSGASPRCRQQCTVAQHQSQGQSLQQRQCRSQQRSPSLSMARCGWTSPYDLHRIGQSCQKKTTAGVTSFGAKLNKTGWHAMQKCWKQLQHKQSQQQKQSHQHKQSHQQ